jgi:hypothetical protein
MACSANLSYHLHLCRIGQVEISSRIFHDSKERLNTIPKMRVITKTFLKVPSLISHCLPP